jgi:hypothetical protein
MSLNLQDISVELERKVVAPISAAAGQAYLSARALFALVFMVIIFAVAARPIVDPDFWWHLRTGQYLVETHTIPHADIFSVVFAGKEWITHEWLSEIFIYKIYQVLGYTGLIVTFAALITLGFAIAYRRCAARAGHVYVVGSVVLLGALAAAPTWNVRPQVFSFLFASIFLKLLDDFQDHQRSRSVWLLIPLMVLWVNMHAGFAVGIALIVLVLAGTVLDAIVFRRNSPRQAWQRLRGLVIVLIGCLAAILLNPSGFRIYSYPFETLRSQAMMKFIEEWRSPNFHELMFQPLALFVLVVIAALALSRKRIKIVELLLLLGTAWAMLRSGRNVPFFVLVALPLVVERVWDWLTLQRWGRWLKQPEKAEGSNALKFALNLILLLGAPMTLAFLRVQSTVAQQQTVETQKFPTAAVEFVRAIKPPQPMYNEYHWGGYLIWKLYPDYRVFIDGRADVYGDAFFAEFMSTHAGEPNWRDSLNRNGVRTVLVTPDSALASLLRQDLSWQKVFEDSQAIIFVKK